MWRLVVLACFACQQPKQPLQPSFFTAKPDPNAPRTCAETLDCYAMCVPATEECMLTCDQRGAPAAVRRDKMARSERGGRGFLDISQNDPGKQTVAPYSLRATSVPLVSMPLAWSELEAPSPIQPQAALARIAEHGDLFAGVLALRQSL